MRLAGASLLRLATLGALASLTASSLLITPFSRLSLDHVQGAVDVGPVAATHAVVAIDHCTGGVSVVWNISTAPEFASVAPPSIRTANARSTLGGYVELLRQLGVAVSGPAGSCRVVARVMGGSGGERPVLATDSNVSAASVWELVNTTVRQRMQLTRPPPTTTTTAAPPPTDGHNATQNATTATPGTAEARTFNAMNATETASPDSLANGTTPSPAATTTTKAAPTAAPYHAVTLTVGGSMAGNAVVVQGGDDTPLGGATSIVGDDAEAALEHILVVVVTPGYVSHLPSRGVSPLLSPPALFITVTVSTPELPSEPALVQQLPTSTLVGSPTVPDEFTATRVATPSLSLPPTRTQSLIPRVITPTATLELPPPNASFFFDSYHLIPGSTLLADPNEAPVWDYLAAPKGPTVDVIVRVKVGIVPSTFYRQHVAFYIACDEINRESGEPWFDVRPPKILTGGWSAGSTLPNGTLAGGAGVVAPVLTAVPYHCDRDTVLFRVYAKRSMADIRGGLQLWPRMSILESFARFHPASNVLVANETVTANWVGAPSLLVLDDLPEEPLEPPPNIPSEEAQTVAWGFAMAAGAVSGVLARPGVGTYGARADATLTAVSCTKTAWDRLTVPFSWHPLRFHFGPGPLSQYAGACLSNASILVLFVATHFAVVLLVSCFSNDTLAASAARLAFPGLAAVPLSLLAFPTAASATTILRVPTPNDTATRVAAVYAILVLFAATVAVGFGLTTAFAAEFHFLPARPPIPSEMRGNRDGGDSKTSSDADGKSSTADSVEADDAGETGARSDGGDALEAGTGASEDGLRSFEGNEPGKEAHQDEGASNRFAGAIQRFWDRPEVRRAWPYVVRVTVGSGWWRDRHPKQPATGESVDDDDASSKAGDGGESTVAPIAVTVPSPPAVKPRFVERFGHLFHGTRQNRQWFFVCDVLIAIGAGCCAGANPLNRQGCIATSSLLALSSVAYLVAFVALRPFAAPLDMASGGLTAVLQAVGDIAVFASVSDSGQRAAGTVGVWCALLTDFFVVLRMLFVIATEVLRRHLAVSWAAAAEKEAAEAADAAREIEARNAALAASEAPADDPACPLLVVPEPRQADPQRPPPRERLQMLLGDTAYQPRRFY